MSVQNLIQLLGGVGLFLFAIKLISDALQLLAGDRLRTLIGTLTRTPVLGVLVGTAVTVLIQSSSATTVMTVSFVDAGLMNLTQAIGVIMGANIGTTITGQILTIPVKNFAYLFVLVGVLLGFFCKNKHYQYFGNGLFGFGLLFVGMQTMEGAMGFLRGRQDLFLLLGHHPLLGLLAGALLTLLVQSSSATVGLTIALGMQGLLPLEAAIPIILGDNIGTTITAVFAAIGTGRAARQACAAHVLFNIIGVCIFLPLMPLYIGLIQATASGVGHQIANTHTLFNICNTLLFLPFVGIFAKLIRKIIPDGPEAAPEVVRYLDDRLIKASPGIAVNAVHRECEHMAAVALGMLDDIESLLVQDGHDHSDALQSIELSEKSLNTLHHAIGGYAERVMRAGVSDSGARHLKNASACSKEIERIGDSCIRFTDQYRQKAAQQRRFSADAELGMQTMFIDVLAAVSLAIRSFMHQAPDALAEVSALSDKAHSAEAALRSMHLYKLSRGECDPETGAMYVDMLGAMEKIAYRATKIAMISSRLD